MKERKALNPLDFTLLYDNILVEQIVLDDDVVDEETGIVRPKNYEDKPEVGTVMSIGNGHLFDNGVVVPLLIQVGDIIYFNKYSSTKVRLDTRDFFIIREDDVQGYLRNA